MADQVPHDPDRQRDHDDSELVLLREKTRMIDRMKERYDEDALDLAFISLLVMIIAALLHR